MQKKPFGKILEFWFEGVTDQVLIDKKQSPFNKWFKDNPSFDQTIRENFEVDLKKAKEGMYNEWAQSSYGSLALVILLDQFSRNLYRNTLRAYENDAQASAISLENVAQGKDLELLLIERLFLYMPLMHAEDVNLQKISVDCFRRLTDDAKKVSLKNAHYYEEQFNYAKNYFGIVQRFGRFTHRNKILGRASTLEELEYLKQKS